MSAVVVVSRQQIATWGERFFPHLEPPYQRRAVESVLSAGRAVVVTAQTDKPKKRTRREILAALASLGIVA